LKHERFVELAKERAYNERGALRPLAAHVRRLYGAIRTLQEDDNSFWYIADIIQQARGDQIDPEDFMARVKTYYHRDRKALCDVPVTRGSRRLVELRSKENSAADRPEPPAVRMLPEVEKDGSAPKTVERSDEAKARGAGDKSQRSAVEKDNQDEEARSSNDLSGLTLALRRRGHRRIAPGG
jgi:hypothetical protein